MDKSIQVHISYKIQWSAGALISISNITYNDILCKQCYSLMIILFVLFVLFHTCVFDTKDTVFKCCNKVDVIQFWWLTWMRQFRKQIIKLCKSNIQTYILLNCIHIFVGFLYLYVWTYVKTLYPQRCVFNMFSGEAWSLPQVSVKCLRGSIPCALQIC